MAQATRCAYKGCMDSNSNDSTRSRINLLNEAPCLLDEQTLSEARLQAARVLHPGCTDAQLVVLLVGECEEMSSLLMGAHAALGHLGFPGDPAEIPARMMSLTEAIARLEMFNDWLLAGNSPNTVEGRKRQQATGQVGLNAVKALHQYEAYRKAAQAAQARTGGEDAS